MKTAGQKISLTLEVLIAVMVLVSWLRMALSLGDNGTISSGGFSNLKYFTILSNLLMGAAAILNVIYTIKSIKQKTEIPILVSRLVYAGASAVMVTMLVVILFLWPVFKIPGLYSGANLWFHLLIPLMGAGAFILGEGRISFRDSFFAMIPVLLYGAWYIGNNIIIGIGEWADTNDWYGFLSWGWGPGVVLFLVLVLMNWGIVLLMRLIHNKYNGAK